MSDDYAKKYRDIDFRKFPHKYPIGKGEQGVLIAEPYKSEILPYWRFANPEVAEASAQKIYQLFLDYEAKKEFVGMDMARKFLQMGFTRARRYANHHTGQKYNVDGSILPQEVDSESSAKAMSARIFYSYYKRVRDNEGYKSMRRDHKRLHS